MIIFSPTSVHSEGPKHDFNFHEGGIIIESDKCMKQIAKKRLKHEFGKFKHAIYFYFTDASVCKPDSPEIWLKWWRNQIRGNDDDGSGPWRSLG